MTCNMQQVQASQVLTPELMSTIVKKSENLDTNNVDAAGKYCR